MNADSNATYPVAPNRELNAGATNETSLEGLVSRLYNFRFFNEREQRVGCPSGPKAIREQPAGCSLMASLSPATGNAGGARRDRTADPLLAKQVLSQLSYGPG